MDHISLKTDLVVIFTTIKKVLLKEDINSDGQNVNDENQQVTIPEFNGDN